MIKVSLYDEDESHFATFDLPELPRKDDHIEIGFLTEEVVKTFVVERIVHKMVQVVEYTVESPATYFATCKNDLPPWRWEYQLHGTLFDPKRPERKCICAPNQDAVKCPQHGDQGANREMCPLCKEHVLGYCAAGEYCTSDACRYVA